MDLTDYIRDIPDFPTAGILFRDITPLLLNPQAFHYAVEQFYLQFKDHSIDVVAAAEARGFIFAAPLALRLNAGFVPIRKPGKLPGATRKFDYALEYGQDALEVHTDGIETGHRVLVVDDLLATGGTVEACCRLVEHDGAEVVGCAFLIELRGLNGRERISPRQVYSVLQY